MKVIHFFGSLAFMAVLFWAFFTHPQGFGEVFMGTIFSILALAFGFSFYASYRQKHGRPIKGVTVTSVITHAATPFVGMQGKGIVLRVKHEDGRMRIMLSPFDYALILVILYIFGPVMIAEYFNNAAHFNQQLQHFKGPWYAIAGICMMVAISTILFFTYLRQMLWKKPVVEVSPEGIRLWRGHKEEAVMRQHDIVRLDVQVIPCVVGGTGNYRTIDNYDLCAVLSGEVRRGLCITDNRADIEAIKTEIERMLNLPATGMLEMVAPDARPRG